MVRRGEPGVVVGAFLILCAVLLVFGGWGMLAEASQEEAENTPATPGGSRGAPAERHPRKADAGGRGRS